MAELKNCEQCGEIFAAVVDSKICPKCKKKEEEAFQTVYRYMSKRKNREATMNEIIEATGVGEDLIIKFLKQNRLRASQFPNLAYGCEKCGKKITEGRLCKECASTIQAALKQHEEIESLEEKRQQEKARSQPIYYTMNKKND